MESALSLGSGLGQILLLNFKLSSRAVILPLVTQTLDNLNFPLTQSNFCFPSDHFYTILPLITRTMIYARDNLGKNHVLKSKTLILF